MLLEYYLWLKAFHVIAFVAWMAAMFYLPRLFVYHTQAEAGSVQSETFKVMERKLMRVIATPAMVATWIFGLLMIMANPDLMAQGWLHLKLTCLVLLSAFHGMSVGWMKKFAADANQKSEKFYRYANEVPTILLIIIVLMAVIRPF